MKRIVVMADGKGVRWHGYLGVPKHLAVLDGESIIERTVRLLNQQPEPYEVIVTSHDPRYQFPGSVRYEPRHNEYEVDRFTRELIMDDMYFLYGDTYYTEEAIRTILTMENEDVLFFGNLRAIVAVRVKDAEVFRTHIDRVRALFIKGKISRCKGWEVYRSVTGQGYDKEIDLSEKFVMVDDGTADINTPQDYEGMLR